MGLRGPQPTDTQALALRGSWRAKPRERESAPVKTKPSALQVDRSGVPELDNEQIEVECRTLIPGYDPWAMAIDNQWFDVDFARRAIEFFHFKLCHVKGAKFRRAFILEAWQRAIIGNLFGWLQESDDGDPVRRYREAFILVPRKNGKSPLAAGIINYLLFEDGEHGAEIYGAASTHQQATLVFEHARGMVMNCEELLGQCKIYNGQAKSIQLTEDYSTYRVVSSDGFAAHGWNTHAGVADELHAWESRDLLDAMMTSTAARRQPLIIEITTADFDRESICNEKHNYASSVRDNGGHVDRPGFDSHFLPVLYEASLSDDWKSIEVWKRTNPNLGVSVKLEHLERECQRAVETPSYENIFKRLHLNIRTQQDVRWLKLEQWDACDAEFDEESLRGRVCYGGLDLSTKLDLSSFSLVFPPQEGAEPWKVLWRCWIPQEGAERRERQDRVPYLAWARQGFVSLTDGNVIDYDFIKAQILEDARTFQIRELGFDPFNANQIGVQLTGEGIVMVEVRQGFLSLSEPSKELERLVISGAFAHGGNPVARWAASHVAIETDAAGNIKPSKKKSTQRIDPIAAVVTALSRAILAEHFDNPYEKRGVQYV